MAGCMTSLIAMMGLSAAGLGALLQAFPSVFEALRLAGAAYLGYLGVMAWRARVPESSPESLSEPVTALPGSRRALYRQGALVAASNPKAILFAAAFFPQFINPLAAKLPQFALLVATFFVIEVAWYFVYALSGHRLARYLQRASVLRTFNRITGGVFIGFAVLMSGIWE
jgi:threonine/homoserine/homoserine lactone efflux protein